MSDFGHRGHLVYCWHTIYGVLNNYFDRLRLYKQERTFPDLLMSGRLSPDHPRHRCDSRYFHLRSERHSSKRVLALPRRKLD
jgi:hypothetical protein